MRILVSGLGAETTTELVRRLTTVEVVDCPTWRAVAILRSAGPFKLLVLGADGIGQDALDMAHKVRDVYPTESLPVIFIVPPDLEVDATFKATTALHITSVLTTPASPEHIVREIATALKLSMSLLTTADLVVTDTQEAAWRRLQVVLARRMDVLERTAKARDGGNTSTLVSRNGVFEATKLAEQLQDVGNGRGAQVANEIADLFGNREQTGESAMVLVDRLRRLLTEAAEETLQGARTVPPPRVLFCDTDDVGAQQWVPLVRNRGMVAAAAYDLPNAIKLIEDQRPDVVVLDPAITPSWDDMVDFFGRLRDVPILVHTHQSDQAARLAASRLGAAAFLPKPAPAEDLIERIEQLLSKLERSRPRVLAVDDDELALAAIEVILAGSDIDCTTLQDPSLFWQTFEAMVPDLVVLDIEMPGVNGLELCRMLRNDPAWKSLPVLMLTAATNPSVVASVYASGADDYASKPITAEELVGRVLNRLERQRLIQMGPDLEPTTGLLSRRRFAQSIAYQVRSSLLSMAVLGLDCFQDVNLAADFNSGDTMLRWMAGLLQRVLPDQAMLGRWCSDQFVVALPGMDLDRACQVLETTLLQVRQEVFGDMAGRPLRLSFSAGVAQSLRDGTTVDALYQAAARAMAQAKRKGRGSILSSSWFETPTYLQDPPEVILVHSDKELCTALRRALQARGRHVESLPDSRNAVTTLVQRASNRPGTVVVLEVTSNNPDTWSLLRMFSRTKAAETARLLVLLDQASKEASDEAFSLGAWFVLGADVQFPQLVQRIREALGTG